VLHRSIKFLTATLRTSPQPPVPVDADEESRIMARKPTVTADHATDAAAKLPAPQMSIAHQPIDQPMDAVATAMVTLKNNVAGAFAGFAKPQIEVKATMDKTVKSAEEFVSFSQGNFEAMMKAGQIWAAGVQDLQKAVSATAQAQVEAAVGSFKALSGVKSLKEAMDMQTSMARSSMETAMAETGKLTDASMKLAEQALAPITARVTLAVEKFGRVA